MWTDRNHFTPRNKYILSQIKEVEECNSGLVSRNHFEYRLFDKGQLLQLP